MAVADGVDGQKIARFHKAVAGLRHAFQPVHEQAGKRIGVQVVDHRKAGSPFDIRQRGEAVRRPAS